MVRVRRFAPFDQANGTPCKLPSLRIIYIMSNTVWLMGSHVSLWDRSYTALKSTDEILSFVAPQFC
jgi:hypothetical protein